ncbi:hypothetical protein EGW08_023523, partial [Elysia chlorotica]
QKRATGDVDFYRDWAAYREGFGNITGDFWLGNEALHTLTSQNDYEMRIDLHVDGKEFYAHSPSFKVESEPDNYRLRLGRPSTITSTLGVEGLTYHNNLAFSTLDRDNDSWPGGRCAVSHHGGWWYAQCHRDNINGLWGAEGAVGVSWKAASRWVYPNFTEMKIRRLPASTTNL